MSGSSTSGATVYVMLIASLPHHGALFAARQPPISRLRLERRLRMLTLADAQTLGRIEDLLPWDRVGRARADAEVVRKARQLMAGLERPSLRRIVRERLEMRTLVAALRRRHRGERAPPSDPDWGFGRWRSRIARHWGEPGFGLERVFPWVLEADRRLAEGDSLGLERLLLGAVWTQLARLDAVHHFDLEAVVIYALRWDVIERWTRYDRTEASLRFAELVEAGLGRHRDLWAEEGAGAGSSR